MFSKAFAMLAKMDLNFSSHMVSSASQAVF